MGGGFKPPRAALAEDRCGERRGKGARWRASGGDRKDGAQSWPFVVGVAGEVSLEGKLTSEPGRLWSASGRAQRVPADWLDGVRHEGDVSPICCSRMEREKACPGSALPGDGWGERECFEIVLREGMSEDVMAYIDGALLIDLWGERVLPVQVRHAWTLVISRALDAAVTTAGGSAS